MNQEGGSRKSTSENKDKNKADVAGKGAGDSASVWGSPVGRDVELAEFMNGVEEVVGVEENDHGHDHGHGHGYRR